MKRLVTAILAFIYMGTSVGATMHLHYCMGKLADWSLSAVEVTSCPECGMEKELLKAKGCCSDEQQMIKMAADQKAAQSSFQAINFFDVALPAALVEVPQVHIASITEANPVGNAPPDAAGVPIYIRNRDFRI